MPLEELIDNFKVWGSKNDAYEDGSYTSSQTVMDGFSVQWTTNTAGTTLTNSHDWEYVGGSQLIKYWDFSAKAYRFFAVAPATAGTVTAGTGSYTVTLPADAATEVSDVATAAEKLAATPYVSRLWFSTGQLPDYSDKQFGQPVTLEFVKPLTRVRFMFTYVYPREGIALTGKSFKPTDGSRIARKGSVTIAFPLTGTETKETLLRTAPDATDATALTDFTEDYDPDDDSKAYAETDEGWYTVLPSNTQGSYTLAVHINGSERTASVPADFMVWQPGYSYTYIFRITEEGGVELDMVQSAFTSWRELSTTHEVYNW